MKRQIAYIDAQGEKVYKDELEQKRLDYLAFEEKRKSAVEVNISEQSEEIKEAHNFICAHGPSLCDAGTVINKEYDKCSKIIKENNFFMRMGRLFRA